MKKFVLLITLLMFATSLGYAETMKGVLTCAMYAHLGQKADQVDPADAKKCVEKDQHDISFIRASDNKVFDVENQKAVKQHVGQRVTITGTAKGKKKGDNPRIHVDSVEPAG